jgi:hypothetical protein
MQAPETQSTSMGVLPSLLVVKMFARVNGLFGKNLVSGEDRPNKPVSGVGKVRADPWTDPS